MPSWPWPLIVTALPTMLLLKMPAMKVRLWLLPSRMVPDSVKEPGLDIIADVDVGTAREVIIRVAGVAGIIAQGGIEGALTAG